MAKVFITRTGTKHYFGNDFLEKGMKIRLKKEPANEYDKEALKVTYEGLGKIGYVAYAKVVLVASVGTICKICKKSLVKEEEAKV